MVTLYTVSRLRPLNAVLRLDDTAEPISSPTSGQNTLITTYQANIEVVANPEPVEILQALQVLQVISQSWPGCLHLSDQLTLLGSNPMCV